MNLQRYHFRESEQLFDNIGVEPCPVSTADYELSLDELNQSWGIIEDKVTGKQFEIGVVGQEHLDDGATCEMSTFTSSLSGNPGNAAEMACHASLPHQKNQTRIFIATPGNGLSSYLDVSERRYVRRTGLFTEIQPGEAPRAIPTIRALARALRDKDIHITRFTTNSSGGRFAQGLMLETLTNQITHAYFKGMPGFTRLRIFRDLVLGMAINENIFRDRENMRKSSDPWKYTEKMSADAADRLPNIYDKEVVSTLGRLASLGKLYMDAVGYARPSAIADAEAALLHQPSAKATYHFTSLDHLYPSIAECINAVGALDVATSEHTASGIEAIVSPGSHADHKYYPSARWACEAYALTR